MTSASLINLPENPGNETSLSIVVPAFNEAERGLDQRLLQSLRYLDAYCPSHELIVVDDGSEDDTPNIVEALGRREPTLRLLRLNQNGGKGAAVRAGLIESRGDRVLFMDADLATPLDEIPRFLGLMDGGTQVLIGSRGLADSILETRENPLREVSGKLYNRLIQWLLLPGIWDTQCGFKMFRGPIARAIAPSMTESSYGFDVELLYLAQAAGFGITETPVHWAHQPNSRLRFLRDGFSMVHALLRIYWKARTGRYVESVAAIRHRYENECANERR